MRVRTTREIYVVQGHYGSHGWEDVTAEDTRRAALVQLRCYRENEPNVAHRVITRRERTAT